MLEIDLNAFFSQPVRVIGLGVFVLIFIGVALRKNRKVHPPIMITCFLVDLALVLYLEFTRGAIKEAADRVMEPMMLIHIIVATLSIGLYVALLITGTKVLRGAPEKLQRIHKRFAITFLVNRVAVLATAIMVSTPPAA